jgi:small redox-active disulfide protein 2
MEIKVLGTGCANCRSTVALIEQVARVRNADVSIQKVEEMQDIVRYGVMSTPAVVIDGAIVHAGGVPSREKIEQWLAAAKSAPAECGNGTARLQGSCCGGAAGTESRGSHEAEARGSGHSCCGK